MTESSLPSNVGTGTVIGKFVTAQKGVSGAPVTVPIVGSVIFTPTPARLLDAASTPPTIILPQPVTITLDVAGAFTVDLVATDDADLNPTGWNYRVSFNLTGLKADPFNINVPQGTTVDLALVAPVASANGTYITRGIGVPDTTGVTTGDVVTWNGTAIAWEPPTGGSGGATTLDGLTDVNTSGVVDGQALVYDTGTASWSVGSIPSTPADIGAVPTTRLVAGHALSADVTLAKADVGLGSVDNTADTAKPVSTAQQAALNLKANTSSLAAVATSGSAADLSTGLLSLARQAAGTLLFQPFTSATAATQARPTSRTDVAVLWIGDATTSSSTLPANALAGDPIVTAA